jgi:FKBP-type peptidyl-prolyl cis-trans isomerase FkpA/FKBP-type peptidyl-prolyl cis-trans isomerase FklB
MTRNRLTALGGAVIFVAFGCAGQREASLETFSDSASYAIGMNMGASLAQVRDQVDLEMVVKGIRAMTAEEAVMTQQEAMQVLRTFAEQVQTGAQGAMTGAAAENHAAGQRYLAENAKREGVTTTESGLQYEVLEMGTGPKPVVTNRVKVHYEGSLIDGTVFESSRDGDPAVFLLSQVIPGWTEGLQLMPVGSTYRFVIPSDLAYGNSGGPGGPGSTLIFEVELLDIVE